MNDRLPIDPGERLIWSGRPHVVRYALRKSLTTFLFGIVWTALTLFGLGGVVEQRDMTATLFLGLFVLVGISMLLSPLWQLWRGMSTAYALTNQRAVVDTTGPFAHRLSLPLGQVPFVELRSSSDGFGDIIFKEVIDSDGDKTNREGFIAISNAAQVERTFRQAIDRASERGPRGHAA